MKKNASLLLLGTGASLGVPLLGCPCEVCHSSDPKNRRFRSAGLLTISGKRFLIDCGPDVRMQALREGITAIDGVLFTHAHQDHTGGLDDLRVFYMRGESRLPCLLSADTLADIKIRFGYLFEPPLHARIDFHVLPQERGTIKFEEIDVRYFTFHQVAMPVNGYRFGDLAYVSDIRDYPTTIFDDLKGVRHLVISALRMGPSHMHLTVDEAVAFANRVGAEQTYLTHLSHDLDHEKTNAYLPQNVRMGYDGLVIDFQPD